MKFSQNDFFEIWKIFEKNFVMGLKSISSFSRSDKFRKISSKKFFSRDFFYKFYVRKKGSPIYFFFFLI